MIRISKWPGLVTAASPYILPAGGSVEQVNAQSLIPGQLTVRGGMRAVNATGSAGGSLIELWGYSVGSGQSEIIFGFNDAGEIVTFTNASVS
jgi:hypothetical protein